MVRPSQIVAEHYRLNMSPRWQAWFDADSQLLRIPGAMQKTLSVDQICAAAPQQIWPGFMLPDTLPLIGNAYGDWLCGRVDADNTISELIYWYHGGGDWIPVGASLAEALLHDTVDHFRPVRSQALRGAQEVHRDETEVLLSRFDEEVFHSWLTSELSTESSTPPATTGEHLSKMASLLRTGDYVAAVQQMRLCGWAKDAAACDLIEYELQGRISAIANPECAEKLGLAWYPDYVNWMFDTANLPLEVTAALEEQIVERVPQQAWAQAGEIAREVVSRREDLGWAQTIAGWAEERSGNLSQALEYYWSGRQASSFADQSVRLNCHSLSEEKGKFALERLFQNRKELDAERLADPYFRLFVEDNSRSILTEVFEFWWGRAETLRADGKYPDAYESYLRSGWDMGVSKLADYERILLALVHCAEKAGWAARARVAETHLACLRSRQR